MATRTGSTGTYAFLKILILADEVRSAWETARRNNARLATRCGVCEQRVFAVQSVKNAYRPNAARFSNCRGRDSIETSRRPAEFDTIVTGGGEKS